MVILFFIFFISYSFHCNYWNTVCMHPPSSSFGVSILFPSYISFVLISLRRTCKERLIERACPRAETEERGGKCMRNGATYHVFLNRGIRNFNGI